MTGMHKIKSKSNAFKLLIITKLIEIAKIVNIRSSYGCQELLQAWLRNINKL